MSSKLNVLIPDGNSTWALSVIQCLSHIDNYKLFVLSNEKRTATKFSKYTVYYTFFKRPNDESWLRIINSEIEKNAIDVILPVAEVETLFFINYKDRISQQAKVIPLPNLKDFEIATNKHKLSDFSNSHTIAHPKSFFVSSEKEKQELLADIRFPILIKPLSQKGGDGILKVSSKSNFPMHLDVKNSPLFIQEFIEGYDIDCSVLCLNGKVLAYTIQKGNLKGHNDFAPQLGFDFLKNEAVLTVAKNTMALLNWSGVAHLDLRFDNATHTFKLIEINARFWGSVDASRVAGINFPHLSIQLALNKAISTNTFDEINYMRLKGVLKSIKRRPWFIFKRKFILNNTEVKMFLKDPLPTAYKFKEWLDRQF
ncbi:ATP-grasp domain-containing protein [Psychroserpens luteolus]|uniref:ATP-grasp domain-containing protein n=1 Tax=Psychroserpens luteolus TaxID=2855840 RepID=UPI001E5AC3CB|nr:ATP-grasp domain-containing protein [Psychroserpens luteolus]MCD2259754.1 ATP-grasp domain-containing protein [Psychroserpens luteolus]